VTSERSKYRYGRWRAIDQLRRHPLKGPTIFVLLQSSASFHRPWPRRPARLDLAPLYASTRQPDQRPRAPMLMPNGVWPVPDSRRSMSPRPLHLVTLGLIIVSPWRPPQQPRMKWRPPIWAGPARLHAYYSLAVERMAICLASLVLRQQRDCTDAVCRSSSPCPIPISPHRLSAPDRRRPTSLIDAAAGS